MPFVRPGERLEPGMRDRVRIATRVRSTLIMSSRAMLRERGFYERYLLELTPAERTELDALVPSWVPTSLIRTHYAAIDRLALSVEDQLWMGRGLFSRMHRPVLDVAVRLAGAMGATPWTVCEQAIRMYPRAYDGGDLLVEQLGPKEARFEILGFPCADLTYCRIAWRGIVLGATELFSRRAYVTEIGAMCTATRLAYRLSWV